jgi:hypothetical protein
LPPSRLVLFEGFVLNPKLLGLRERRDCQRNPN